MTWDGVVHRASLRDGEELRAAVTDYRGRRWISLRVYFRGSDGAWHPTKKGVTLAADLLPDLETAIAAIRRAVDSEPPPARRPDRYTRYNRAREGGGSPYR